MLHGFHGNVKPTPYQLVMQRPYELHVPAFDLYVASVCRHGKGDDPSCIVASWAWANIIKDLTKRHHVLFTIFR
jgi:hypothetical protein